MADEPTGVNIDRGHGLSLIDDQIPSRLELHFPLQSLLDLILYVVEIEDGSYSRIILYATFQFRHEGMNKFINIK